MAYDYTNHSRFFYASSREIEDYINQGVVNKWDLVLCQDTKEFMLITDKLEMVPIKSKVYRYTTVAEAEAALNDASDTYQGQMVSILSLATGSYQAYIVNKNNAGRFYVSPISVYNASDIDYNEIGHRPIEQISGNIENPIMLTDLSDGLYKIEGAYKVSTGLKTIFQTRNGDIISVTHETETGNTAIKVITSSSITDYLIDNTGGVIDRGTYITKEWIERQGYMTSDDMDAKLDALNVITRDEAVSYIQELIRESVEQTVNDVFDETFNERFDTRLRQQLVMEEQQNIRNLF